MQPKIFEAKFLIALLAVSSLVVAAPTLEARTKPKANEYDSPDWYVHFLRSLAVRLHTEHLYTSSNTLYPPFQAVPLKTYILYLKSCFNPIPIS